MQSWTMIAKGLICVLGEQTGALSKAQGSDARAEASRCT